MHNIQPKSNKNRSYQTSAFYSILECIHGIITENYDLPKSVLPSHLKIYLPDDDTKISSASSIPEYTDLASIIAPKNIEEGNIADEECFASDFSKAVTLVLGGEERKVRINELLTGKVLFITISDLQECSPSSGET